MERSVRYHGVVDVGDEVKILDGGLATELERRGLDLNDPLWSAKILVEAPEAIEAVHFDYFVAGADIGTSASYQASFEGFAARGIGARESEVLLRRSVELVERARDRFWSVSENRVGRKRPLVAASIGCYGATLHDGSEYRGDYGLSLKELMDFHRPRLHVLADSGADLLAFETIPSKLEGDALRALLEEFPEAPPSWISFSCRNGTETCHGEPLADCLAAADGSGIAIGINCTPPRWISALLRSAPGASVVYPNSGEVWDARRKVWTGESSGRIEDLAPEWKRLGARVTGGCCRTTPATIAAVRASLQESRL
jgi:homocysteine S-methyltransferase